VLIKIEGPIINLTTDERIVYNGLKPLNPLTHPLGDLNTRVIIIIITRGKYNTNTTAIILTKELIV
jgi:hypothetical protein